MNYPLEGFANFELFNRELFSLSGDNLDDRFRFETIVRNNSERVQMVDTKTSRKYEGFNASIVVIKEFLLLGAIPIYTAAKMTYQLAMTIFDLCKHAINVTCSLVGGILEEDGEDVHEAFTNLAGDLKKDLYEIARSPIYAIALEFAALKGVVETVFVDWNKAFEAQVIFGDIEANWHNNARHTRGIQDYAVGRIAYSEVETTYLAQCFQPFRNSMRVTAVAAMLHSSIDQENSSGSRCSSLTALFGCLFGATSDAESQSAGDSTVSATSEPRIAMSYA